MEINLTKDVSFCVQKNYIEKTMLNSDRNPPNLEIRYVFSKNVTYSQAYHSPMFIELNICALLLCNYKDKSFVRFPPKNWSKWMHNFAIGTCLQTSWAYNENNCVHYKCVTCHCKQMQTMNVPILNWSLNANRTLFMAC